jgi:hypothetical protein
MNYFLKIEVYFLAIPGWLIAAALYLALAKALHKPVADPQARVRP